MYGSFRVVSPCPVSSRSSDVSINGKTYTLAPGMVHIERKTIKTSGMHDDSGFIMSLSSSLWFSSQFANSRPMLSSLLSVSAESSMHFSSTRIGRVNPIFSVASYPSRLWRHQQKCSSCPSALMIVSYQPSEISVRDQVLVLSRMS